MRTFWEFDTSRKSHRPCSVGNRCQPVVCSGNYPLRQDKTDPPDIEVEVVRQEDIQGETRCACTLSSRTCQYLGYST